jgi:hypothetical protein
VFSAHGDLACVLVCVQVWTLEGKKIMLKVIIFCVFRVTNSVCGLKTTMTNGNREKVHVAAYPMVIDKGRSTLPFCNYTPEPTSIGNPPQTIRNCCSFPPKVDRIYRLLQRSEGEDLMTGPYWVLQAL